MSNDVKSQIAHIKKAKTVLGEYNEQLQLIEVLKESIADLNLKKQNLGTSNEQEANTIIRDKQLDIEESYRKKLEQVDKEIGDAKLDRKTEKQKQVDSRVETELSPYKEIGKGLHNDLNKLFADYSISGFFRTRYIFGLLYPTRFIDYVVIVVSALFFILGIPYIIYLFFPHMKVLILSFVACLFIFGGLYILMFNRIRAPHEDVFNKGKLYWDKIILNNKEMEKVEAYIRREKNEDKYDLSTQDENIKNLKDKYESLKQEKEIAKKEFEKTTLDSVIKEVEQSKLEELERIDTKIKEVEEKLEENEKKLKEIEKNKKKYVDDIVGAQHANMDTLDKLMKVIKTDEEATTIQLALKKI